MGEAGADCRSRARGLGGRALARVGLLARADHHSSSSRLVGSNYIPATAINELELWQADTFDTQRIDLELGSNTTRRVGTSLEKLLATTTPASPKAWILRSLQVEHTLP